MSSDFTMKPCVEMSLHVVDNSICVLCVCYPIPCLSVENVSVTTMVPPTPSTTQPITSHPATPTFLTPSFAPDAEGKAHTPLYSVYAILHWRVSMDSHDLQGADHVWLALLFSFKKGIIKVSYTITTKLQHSHLLLINAFSV